MPIREVGRSGERKNPRGGRKKRKKARTGRLGPGLKHHLGAIDHGAKFGAKIYGAERCLPSHRHVCVEPKTSVPAAMVPSSVSLAPATMTLS